MKIRYFFSLLTIFIILLTSCNKYDENDREATYSIEDKIINYKEKKAENKNDSQNEYSTEAETNEQYYIYSDDTEEGMLVEKIELKPFNDEYISEMIINGERLVIPMSFSDLENAGWIYNGDSAEKIPAKTSQNIQRWNKDGVQLFTTITNFSINAMPCMECTITELDYKYKPYNMEMHDVSLDTGITVHKSVYDDVISIYGEDGKTHEGNDYKILRYKYDKEHEAIFSFDSESNILRHLSIKCEDEPKNINNEVSEERPEILDNYVKPVEKSDSPYDAIFELDGELYSLPCPVEKFIENGWNVGQGNESTVISGTCEFYTLEKDDIKLDVILENYVENAVCAKYAYVTEIWADAYDGVNIPLIVHGDVTLGEKIEVEDLKDKYKDMTVTLNDSYNNMVIVNMEPADGSETGIVYSMVIKNGVLESIGIYDYAW